VGISIGSCLQIFTEKNPDASRQCKIRAHASLLTRSYLAKHHTSVVPHPPYSPYLAPANFFLFPKLKTALKLRRFQALKEIQENTIRELVAITGSAFQESISIIEEMLGTVHSLEGDSAYNSVK
jgi:hypothetical protein